MLKVENLNKKYGRHHVLKDVSFTLEQGEIALLVGRNGEGKTTLLKSMMNLLKYTGTVTLDDEIIRDKVYNKIALISDQLTMNPDFTSSEAFEFMADFFENFDKVKALKLSEDLCLNVNKKLETYREVIKQNLV